MSALFNLIGTLFKTGVFLGVTTMGTVGAFAYATKPDEAMLRKALGRELTGQSEGTVPVIGSTIANIVTVPFSIEMKDFVVLRTATVTSLGKERIYVGAFQNWVLLDKLNL